MRATPEDLAALAGHGVAILDHLDAADALLAAFPDEALDRAVDACRNAAALIAEDVGRYLATDPYGEFGGEVEGR